jgi:pyrroline-5-carboxylate reductase
MPFDLSAQHLPAPLAIIGAGNIGSALARGLVASGLYKPALVTLVRRQTHLLAPLAHEGFRITADAKEALAAGPARIVVLAVQPQQLNDVLRELAREIDGSRQLVISLVSGVSIAEILAQLQRPASIVRAMPNTAIAIRESMTCLAVAPALRVDRGTAPAGAVSPDAGVDAALDVTRALFDTVGRTLVIEEELMIPATALCACGVAFFLRSIRAASQGGIEIGFHPDEAALLAAQTAKGAAALLLAGATHPESEIDKVTTPRGCTIAGLNRMEHEGFSSAMIKGITTSAEKAGHLYDSAR